MGFERRAVWVLAVLAVAATVAGAGAAVDEPRAESYGAGPYEGRTLVSEQGYEYGNGQVSVVTESGEQVWSYAPPNAMVFDAEWLTGDRRNGDPTGTATVLVAVGEAVASDADCPAPYDGGREGCIENRVVEVAYPSNEVVWSYEWYDAYPHNHEVHDADRLADGRTVIADMGNDRVFVVAENGTITWEWNATRWLGEGSRFWNEHVPESERDRLRREGPETDWTHLNDVDLLENGNYLVSIRNFDVLVEVDPETKRVVNVTGTPGDATVLDNQHNPYRLDDGTTLVADSENDRVVEYAPDGERVWAYEGSRAVNWPRDADRLPNGNTLIADSFNDRVIEVNPDGEVVWVYRGAEMAYSADRLSVPEEAGETVSGRELDSHAALRHPVVNYALRVLDWLPFVFPTWVGLPELVGGLAVGWLAVDGAVTALRRRLGR